MTRAQCVMAALLASCGGAAASGVGDPSVGADQAEPVEQASETAGAAEADPADAGSAAGPAGRVTLEPVTCDPPGSVDEAAIDAQFEAMLPALGECYAAVLERDTGLDGKYVMQVALAADQGVARSTGYTCVRAGFWIAGFEECLGGHLLRAEVEVDFDDPITCDLVLHFAVEIP